MKKLFTAAILMLVLASMAAAQSQQGVLNAAGAACNANNCVSLPVNQNNSGATIQLAGTFTATISFEATSDGGNYVPIAGTLIGGSAPATSATTAGVWQFGTSGLIVLRARINTGDYTSGNAQTTIRATNGSPPTSTTTVIPSGAIETECDGGVCATETTQLAIKTAVENTLPVLVIPVGGTIIRGAITSAMESTTSTQVIAGTADNYQYITWCVVSNADLTVSTDILLQDGSGGTTLAVLPAPSAATASTGGAGGMYPFPTPIPVPTAGNGLFAANVTTSAMTKITCGGWRSTIAYF